MIKVSLPWIIEGFNEIEKVGQLSTETTSFDLWFSLYVARNRLDEIYLRSIYSSYLRASAKLAMDLKDTLVKLIEKTESIDSPNYMLEAHEVGELRYASTKFLSVFMSEIGIIPVFCVMPKEGYDVTLLADRGVNLFPASILSKVPEAERDMNEAGKALVYELPTACGFHVFRILESVIRKYWDHTSQGKDHPKLTTIGAYAAELSNNKYGEAKVWETLQQINKLHRNPLIHPEVILSSEEAVETIGIVRSAIGAMLRVMPELPITTSTAIAVSTVASLPTP